jgi:hypothetical protein
MLVAYKIDRRPLNPIFVDYSLKGERCVFGNQLRLLLAFLSLGCPCLFICPVIWIIMGLMGYLKVLLNPQAKQLPLPV